MRALSVQQPCAGLIVSGWKDAENRAWPCGHRGLLLIHAGKRVDADGARWLLDEKLGGGAHLMEGRHLPQSSFHRGAIVGAVNMIDCRERKPDAAGVFSPWHFEGQYGFYFVQAMEFESPIACAGALGLFAVKGPLEDHCRIQIAGCGARQAQAEQAAAAAAYAATRGTPA